MKKFIEKNYFLSNEISCRLLFEKNTNTFDEYATLILSESTVFSLFPSVTKGKLHEVGIHLNLNQCGILKTVLCAIQ